MPNHNTSYCALSTKLERSQWVGFVTCNLNLQCKNYKTLDIFVIKNSIDCIEIRECYKCYWKAINKWSLMEAIFVNFWHKGYIQFWVIFVIRNSIQIKFIQIELWSPRLFVCFSHLDLPNHNTSCHSLSIIENPLMNKVA